MSSNDIEITPEDIISTASANQSLALSSEQVMTDLIRRVPVPEAQAK